MDSLFANAIDPGAEAALAVADRLAAAAHDGQVDMLGRPYIEHVRWVRDRLANEPGVSTDQLVAAVLHDVIEDGGLSEQFLVFHGVSPTAARYVSVLSRRRGETYAEFIERVCRDGGRLVVQIKLQDVRHHLSRMAALAVIDPKRAASLGRRYQAAEHRLMAFLAAAAGERTDMGPERMASIDEKQTPNQEAAVG